MKVTVLGAGAIGGVVARALAAGEVPGAALLGVVHRDPLDPPDLPVLDSAAGIAGADLVVECAGHAALAQLGPSVVAAGKDLLAVSVGALTDDAVLAALSAGPGRVHLSTGAVGGLDLLRAAARTGPLSARVTTTKAASALGVDGAGVLRSGPAREIAAAFPRSTNVVAAVALAVGAWDRVEAAVVADPDATRTSHVIEAWGAAGEYRFEIRNATSARTPTTSAVVPHAVLRAIADLTGTTGALR